MGDQSIAPRRTELQQLCEDMRVVQLHLSNLLRIASKDAYDELESVMAAAQKYCLDDYELWGQISAIADEMAKKGGA